MGLGTTRDASGGYYRTWYNQGCFWRLLWDLVQLGMFLESIMGLGTNMDASGDYYRIFGRMLFSAHRTTAYDMLNIVT